MKKLLLATGIVIAQAASMSAFAQNTTGGAMGTPAPSAQANGEKGTAPAGPRPDMAGGSASGKSSSTPRAGMAPAPTTETTGEKARMPAERQPATGSADTSGRASTAARKAAPTPAPEANGEKADKKGGVGEMKPTGPAR
nr:hypothetical protein [Variovorax boronicumulans]